MCPEMHLYAVWDYEKIKERIIKRFPITLFQYKWDTFLHENIEFLGRSYLVFIFEWEL